MFRERLSLFPFRRFLAALPILAGLALAWDYPLGTLCALAIFSINLIVMYFTTIFWIAALPVALVIGDLYPQTGRLLFAESDWFLLALLAVWLWRAKPRSQRAPRRIGLWVLWLPLVVSVVISCHRGWQSLPTSLPGDALSMYANHWNSLRVAKGFGWGFVVASLLIAALSEGSDRFAMFVRGMQVSALVVSVIVVLERCISVGLLDREQLYRATGPFMSMHTGGQHIDAYWAMALPFVFLPISRRTWLDFSARGCLLLLSYYAIVATMSRGIIVLAGIMSVILVLLSIFEPGKRRTRWQTYATAAAALLLMAVVGVVAFSNRAIAHRFTESRRDFAARWHQWEELCQAADRTWLTTFLGNGLGTVPSIASRAFHEPLRTSELVALPDGRVALRIRPGKAVYVEQGVEISAPGPWQMRVQFRTEGRIDLHAYVCRKSLFDSFRCSEEGFSGSGQSSAWQTTHWTVDTKRLLPPLSAWRYCPVTLAFSATNDGKFVDVCDLELTDARGQSLLTNADFQDGSAHWFFTSDDHSAWRAENMWVHLYLEQGWLGAISAAFLILGTLGLLVRKVVAGGDLAIYALTVAIVGFLAMGLFGSMLETPWITTMFCALLAVSQARSRPRTP